MRLFINSPTYSTHTHMVSLHRSNGVAIHPSRQSSSLSSSLLLVPIPSTLSSSPPSSASPPSSCVFYQLWQHTVFFLKMALCGTVTWTLTIEWFHVRLQEADLCSQWHPPPIPTITASSSGHTGTRAVESEPRGVCNTLLWHCRHQPGCPAHRQA